MVQRQLEQHLIEVTFVIDIFEGMESESQFSQEVGLILRQHILEMKPPECFASLAIGATERNIRIAIPLIVRNEGLTEEEENYRGKERES